MPRFAATVVLVALSALGCRHALAPSTAPSPATPAATPPSAASAEAAAAPASPSTAAPAPAAAPRIANTIRWSTASEVDNFGFDVYRAEAADGPFVRLTAKPVAGAQTTDEPQAYAFVDDTILPGRAYFYFVESISLAGVRERFTPVIRAGPKGLPAPAPTGAP